MRRTILIASLLIAGCGSSSGDEKEAAASAKAASAESALASLSFTPGQWEVTTEILAMNLPNMPKGAETPKPPATTVRHCLTPEQAAKPAEGFFTGAAEQRGCRSDNMQVGGGRISGRVQCDGEGVKMSSDVNGRFTATSFETDQRVQTEGGGQSMTIEARTRGRRIGDCPA